MQSRDLNCCALKLNILFKTFQWSALHKKKVQCNSMDKNVDQCPLNQIPQRRRKILLCFFSVSVLLLASVERFGVSRMRDFLFLSVFFLFFLLKFFPFKLVLVSFWYQYYIIFKSGKAIETVIRIRETGGTSLVGDRPSLW